MKNKVLVELIVPVLEERYDVYIPVNRKVGNVIELCSKVVSDLSGGYFTVTDDLNLYSGIDGSMYDIDEIVRKTNIRNGSKLILM